MPLHVMIRRLLRATKLIATDLVLGNDEPNSADYLCNNVVHNLAEDVR